MLTLLTITPHFLNRFLLKFPTFASRKPETKEGGIVRRTIKVLRTSITVLKSRLFVSYKPENKEDRIVRRARHVVKTSCKLKYHKKCLIRYARKNGYQTEVLLEILGLLRVRRQHVLKAAWMNPWIHPLRSLYFFKTSFGLQSEMEDIFVELYRLTGNQFFLQEISEARFVTPRFHEKMVRARREYLEQTQNVQTSE